MCLLGGTPGRVACLPELSPEIFALFLSMAWWMCWWLADKLLPKVVMIRHCQWALYHHQQWLFYPWKRTREACAFHSCIYSILMNRSGSGSLYTHVVRTCTRNRCVTCLPTSHPLSLPLFLQEYIHIHIIMSALHVHMCHVHTPVAIHILSMTWMVHCVYTGTHVHMPGMLSTIISCMCMPPAQREGGTALVNCT